MVHYWVCHTPTFWDRFIRRAVSVVPLCIMVGTTLPLRIVNQFAYKDFGNTQVNQAHLGNIG